MNFPGPDQRRWRNIFDAVWAVNMAYLDRAMPTIRAIGQVGDIVANATAHQEWPQHQHIARPAFEGVIPSEKESKTSAPDFYRSPQDGSAVLDFALNVLHPPQVKKPEKELSEVENYLRDVSWVRQMQHGLEGKVKYPQQTRTTANPIHQFDDSHRDRQKHQKTQLKSCHQSRAGPTSSTSIKANTEPDYVRRFIYGWGFESYEDYFGDDKSNQVMSTTEKVRLMQQMIEREAKYHEESKALAKLLYLPGANGPNKTKKKKSLKKKVLGFFEKRNPFSKSHGGTKP